MFVIDLSEIHHLAADLAAAGERVVPAVQREVARGGYRVHRDAMAATPVDSGHLRASFGGGPDIGDLSFEVGPTANYGAYVELGTSGPYVIPNAFGRGYDTFVMHPGISPQPYLGPAYDKDLPKTERGILKAAADRTLG